MPAEWRAPRAQRSGAQKSAHDGKDGWWHGWEGGSLSRQKLRVLQKKPTLEEVEVGDVAGGWLPVLVQQTLPSSPKSGPTRKSPRKRCKLVWKADGERQSLLMRANSSKSLDNLRKPLPPPSPGRSAVLVDVPGPDVLSVPTPPRSKSLMTTPILHRQRRLIGASVSSRRNKALQEGTAQLCRVAAALSQLRWMASRGRSVLEVVPEQPPKVLEQPLKVSVQSWAPPSAAADAAGAGFRLPSLKEVLEFRAALREAVQLLDTLEGLEDVHREVLDLLTASSPGVSGRFVVLGEDERAGLSDLVHAEVRKRLSEISEVPELESAPNAETEQQQSWRDRVTARGQRHGFRKILQSTRKKQALAETVTAGGRSQHRPDQYQAGSSASNAGHEDKNKFHGLQRKTTIPMEDSKLSIKGAESLKLLSFAYRSQQQSEYAEQFRRFDADNSGTVDASEVILILRDLGHDTMMHVLEENIKEVDVAGKGELNETQFQQLLELIRVREGFRKTECDRFLEAFHVFDKDGSGQLSTFELANVLRWLDFSYEQSWLTKVVQDIDVDDSGQLNKKEFLKCMRKVRDFQVGLIKQAMEASDDESHHRISARSVGHVLKALGYPAEQGAVNDAIEDCGFDLGSPLDLDMIWQVFELYRSREGFGAQDTAEIDNAFTKYDEDGSGEVSTLETRKLLRWLGCFLSWETERDLVSLVNLDNSGELNRAELRKLVRMCRHAERKEATKRFEAEDTSGDGLISPGAAVYALQTLGCYYDRRQMPQAVDLDLFLGMARSGRRSMLEKFRGNHCFTDAEIEKMRKTFLKFDVDNSGEISREELFKLCDEDCPELMGDRRHRQTVVRIMGDITSETRTNGLDFDGYARLKATMRDSQDKARIKKEQAAVRETGFTSDEVAEFRQIFLAADENGDGELTLEEAREMVMRVCPFSSEHHNQFNKIFAEVAQKQMHLEGSGDEADFPEFLWLMRSILDADFASVAKQSSTLSEKSFTERRSTRMAKDGAFRGTRTRRTTSKQFADLQPVKERPDSKG